MKLMGSKAAVAAPEKGRRERQAEAREARALEARAAAAARSERGKARLMSMKARVEVAQKELDRPANLARDLLEHLSPRDLQVYLLAEELGKARKTVLLGYPPAARSVRDAYELESGSETPSTDSKE